MTDQKEFMRRIVKGLDDSDIPYMLSGSIGSGFHGRPRATNDVDIVINPVQENLLAFVESLGSEYYVSKEAALQALKNNSMFNIIDIKMGWKADLIIRKNRTYSKEEFNRRINAEVMGAKVWILSAEDSVLSKMEWSKGRDSKIQFDDALGVLMVQRDKLDFGYLKKWARELKVEGALETLLKEIDK